MRFPYVYITGQSSIYDRYVYVVPSVVVHEQKAHGYGLQWAVDRRDQCLLHSWALPTVWSKIKHVYNDFDGSVVLMSHSDAQISMAKFVLTDRWIELIALPLEHVHRVIMPWWKSPVILQVLSVRVGACACSDWQLPHPQVPWSFREKRSLVLTNIKTTDFVDHDATIMYTHML